MSSNIKAYVNCDAVHIIWSYDERIPNCRGFALLRKRNGGAEETVNTFVGFEGESAPKGTYKPSTTWPVQKFMWTDYQGKKDEGTNFKFDDTGGDTLEYRVVPMTGSKDSLTRDDTNSTVWSNPVKVNPAAGVNTFAYFNRGIIMSQFVTRRLGDQGSGADSLKKLIAKRGDNTRNFLAGKLRLALMQIIAEAKETKGKIYAALFELNDPDLLDALKSLGKKANVILANGAHKKKGDDENKAVRNALKKTINIFNRMVPTGRLAHNKFLVLCDKNNKPVKAWTGSTNWSMTGLCTQANNGILFCDTEMANFYFDQWKQLKAAKNDFTKTLEASNDEVKKCKKSSRRVWFTPLRDLKDLDDANELINGAKHGILFLMFNPGPHGTLLNTIIERNSPQSANYDATLYIHGVVNQDPSTKKTPVVGLFHRGEYVPSNFDIVMPEGINEQMTYWAAEIKRSQFLKQIGWAMVHCKVIVVDPFGEHPVVMTGSHNLGPKASSSNDDNLVIIENDPGLAAAYAVNIMGVYNQYRFRYYLSQSKHPDEWTGLQDNDTWQDGYFGGAKLNELKFWLG